MKDKMTAVMVLAATVIAGGAQANDINMWREPAPVVKEGKFFSVIQDRGTMQKAVKNSNNEFLFSEKGAGVKPLVLIGSPVEIFEYLEKNQTRGIENHLQETPEIYMGITKYVPHKRFNGLFPIQDFLVKTLEQVLKFVPTGTVITDAAGIPADLKELYRVTNSFKSKEKSSGDLLYVKFSYLPEDGMQKIGTHSVSFGRILQLMQNKN